MREQRVLVAGAEQHPRFVAHDVFGAVAVVDIEIHDRHPREAVLVDGMTGRDSHVIEKTKAHRPGIFGVVAGRAHGTEGVGCFAGHDRIHRGDAGAGGIARRGQSVGRQNGIFVQRDMALAGGHVIELLDMKRVVDLLNELQINRRRAATIQAVGDADDVEAFFDGHQPSGLFRVTVAHVMGATDGIGGEVRRRHGRPVPAQPACTAAMRSIRLVSVAPVYSAP